MAEGGLLVAKDFRIWSFAVSALRLRRGQGIAPEDILLRHTLAWGPSVTTCGDYSREGLGDTPGAVEHDGVGLMAGLRPLPCAMDLRGGSLLSLLVYGERTSGEVVRTLLLGCLSVEASCAPSNGGNRRRV